MTYEIIKAIEKRSMIVHTYSMSMFNEDYEILMKLYRLAKTQRVDRDIDVYFKIKFFRQLERFPFINPICYTNLPDGLHLAVRDVDVLAFKFFFI